jgi:hypothetical protein
MAHACLVCGYAQLKSPPRSSSGGGSYEICPACGYQYGVDDDDLGITPAQHRARWIQKGAPWSSVSIKPPKNWQPPQVTAKKATAKRKVSKTTVKKATGKKAAKKKSK